MKLTERKGNKYFALESLELIIRKLEPIEHKAPELLAKICDGYCMYPQVLSSQEAVDAKCERCPMKELMEMIE